ncbi:MAG: RNA-guided endonuclease TnpB family protein, partial [Candidatus Hodarchaeota archaeon]
MIITRTEQIWLNPHENLSWLCHLSKNLYNEGNYLIRQEFFTNGNWVHYNSLYHLLKTSNNYSQLPA